MKIGGETAFQLMVPLLAGYIAYSIADRPGLAPGMIGGLLAGTLGAGFIGGIIAGFVAGYAAKAVSRWIPLPASIESLKPILIIPLLASLVTGLVMIYIVGTPVAKLAGLTEFLDTMGTSNAILLGLLLGTMMCVDLGGPVNKAAYAFSVGLLASQSYAPMAATMAAGMVPPIGMGIATLIARRKFAQTEREAGKAALVLGCCFISEGAIPFAARIRCGDSGQHRRWCSDRRAVHGVRCQAAGAPWRAVRAADPQRDQPCIALPGRDPGREPADRGGLCADQAAETQPLAVGAAA